MPNFSRGSNIKLGTCHPKLQRLFREVIKEVDCTVVWGFRGEEIQNGLFEEGFSEKEWPDSKHNQLPALAIDVAPYIKGKGVVWEPRQCYYFAGYVMAVAERLGIKIICGADWDKDFDVNDQSLRDICHFQIEKDNCHD
jgi:hypothetical protein